MDKSLLCREIERTDREIADLECLLNLKRQARGALLHRLATRGGPAPTVTLAGPPAGAARPPDNHTLPHDGPDDAAIAEAAFAAALETAADEAAPGPVS